MDDRHLTVDLLKAVHRGERSPGDLATIAMAHLFEKCPRCRRTFEEWRREVSGATSAEDLLQGRYDEAFDRVRSRLCGDSHDAPRGASWETEVAAQEARAPHLVEELLKSTPHDRLELVRQHPDKFVGPALADLLLEEAKNHLPGRPVESRNLSLLARAVLQHGEASPYETELYARALAYQANSLRAEGELRNAGELIEVSRFLLKPQGGGDRLTKAELDSFEGSIRRAQRRLDEAQSLFSSAVMAYAMEGFRLEAGRNLLSLALVLRELDEKLRAVEVTTQALEIIHEEGSPELHLYALHNLAWLLNEVGEWNQAQRVFQETQPLYQSHGGPKMLYRRSWLEGHLARAAGDLVTAEACYQGARNGFLELGNGYDAAIAALDLATLYAEQGRTADLKKLAEDIVPIFEAQDVHREAAAALMLFQDAVRAEQVTLRYLIELSRYLEHARLDPHLTFQRPA